MWLISADIPNYVMPVERWYVVGLVLVIWHVVVCQTMLQALPWVSCVRDCLHDLREGGVVRGVLRGVCVEGGGVEGCVEGCVDVRVC